jgi:phospholipid/cholesterol/gamma-HCH transport system substrate-binding protein
MSRELRLGLFTVGTLGLLAAGVFLIGRRQSMFSSTYPIKAEFDNVGGLIGGAAVRVGGMYQGTVSRIQLPQRTTDRVVVVMDLDKATRNLIRTNSIASIKAEGVLGDKFVEVSVGSEAQRIVRDGETIQGAPMLDISDLFHKADRILDTTTEVVKNTEQLTGNLSAVSAKINEGRGTMGALVNDKTLYRQAAEGTTSFRENMQALKRSFFFRGFFRDRGYENARDLEEHAVPSLPKSAPLKRFTYDAGRLFDKDDNAKLDKEEDLRAAGAFLESNQFGMAVVVASEGMKGDSQEAEMLTQARAVVVRNYLVSHFRFDDTRLKTLGLGKTKDARDAGMVELVVFGPKAN